MTPNWPKSGPDGGRKAITIDAESSGTPRALDMRHQGVPAAPLHLAALPVAKSAQRLFFFLAIILPFTAANSCGNRGLGILHSAVLHIYRRRDRGSGNRGVRPRPDMAGFAFKSR